jgi:hypothetical protein
MAEDYVDLGVWSTIEVPTGIVCACMPSIRSLVRHAFPALFPATKNESSVLSLPKVANFGNMSSAKGNLNNKPKHQDQDSFVQLMELHSYAEGKV